MIYFNKDCSLLADLEKNVRTLIFPVLTMDISFFTEYKLQGYKSIYVFRCIMNGFERNVVILKIMSSTFIAQSGFDQNF